MSMEFEPIIELAKQIASLHDQAFLEYQPVVDDIIFSQKRDIPMIEQTLDSLLDFCGDNRFVELFRSLCCYYWKIDQTATAEYIFTYRDMWDSRDE